MAYSCCICAMFGCSIDLWTMPADVASWHVKRKQFNSSQILCHSLHTLIEPDLFKLAHVTYPSEPVLLLATSARGFWHHGQDHGTNQNANRALFLWVESISQSSFFFHYLGILTRKKDAEKLISGITSGEEWVANPGSSGVKDNCKSCDRCSSLNCKFVLQSHSPQLSAGFVFWMFWFCTVRYNMFTHNMRVALQFAKQQNAQSSHIKTHHFRYCIKKFFVFIT